MVGVSLSNKAIRAGMMTIGARLLSRIVDFVALLVLARHLGAADFGLVAMAMTVVFVVESIFEMPLVAALLRLPEITDEHCDTAFTLGLIRGLVVAALMAGISWPLSSFYDDARLVPLICALALAPTMRGMINPRMVIFDKAMDFRRRAMIELLGKVIATACAIVVVIETDSYWAMAIGTICAPTVMVIASYIMVPARPRLSLTGWQLFSNMTVWSFFSQSIIAINWQVDRLLLPLYVDTTAFGRFATANNLAELPYQAVVAPTAAPLFSALVSAKERGNLQGAYLKACTAIVMLMAPVLCFLAFMAGPVIDILLGPGWIEAAPILAGLSVAGLISLQTIPMPSLAMALNQTRNVAIRATVEMMIRVPLSVAGIAWFGIDGAIAAKACAAAGILAATMFAVRRLAGISIGDQLAANIRPALALAPALALLYGANHVTDLYDLVYLKVIVTGLLYVLVYAGALYLVWLASGRPPGLDADVFNLLSKRMGRRTGASNKSEAVSTTDLVNEVKN